LEAAKNWSTCMPEASNCAARVFTVSRVSLPAVASASESAVRKSM
jgi:hypothetical protein